MSRWKRADPSARVTDPDAVRSPRETTFAAAQDAVNFVVFAPERLPSDCRVETVTVRPEQPPGRPEGVDADDVGQTPWSDGNPSSVRAIVRGEDRRLRLKQFLYDKAPPAASVAPLWETPEPVSLECGDVVGWLGTDYKDNRGACVQRARTQLELSVLEGSFDDAELRDVLAGAIVAAPEAARSVQRAPFHALHYWLRYGVEPEAVPHGLWDHDAVRPFDAADRLSAAALSRASVQPLLAPDDRFLFDSAAAFPTQDALECVFRHRANGNDFLWIQAAVPDSDLAPELPPEPSAQPAATREAIDCRGETVHYAALTEATGAWEAIWDEDGVRYAVWAGASLHLDGEAFRSTIEALAPP